MMKGVKCPRRVRAMIFGLVYRIRIWAWDALTLECSSYFRIQFKIASDKAYILEMLIFWLIGKARELDNRRFQIYDPAMVFSETNFRHLGRICG